MSSYLFKKSKVSQLVVFGEDFDTSIVKFFDEYTKKIKTKNIKITVDQIYKNAITNDNSVSNGHSITLNNETVKFVDKNNISDRDISDSKKIVLFLQSSCIDNSTKMIKSDVLNRIFKFKSFNDKKKLLVCLSYSTREDYISNSDMASIFLEKADIVRGMSEYCICLEYIDLFSSKTQVLKEILCLNHDK